jgi:hypothetical protein
MMATVDDLWGPMVQVESGGNPDAVGKAGEIGLVQIKPSTAAEYGVTPEALRHPEVQRMLFNRIMGKYLARYGDIPRAVAAWNAGQHGVDIGRFPQQYVNKVLSLYRGGRPPTLATIAPAVAPARRILARSTAPAFWRSTISAPDTDTPEAETPEAPEAQASPFASPGRRRHPATEAATGYLEDRMNLVLMTMGVPQQLAKLYAGAYGTSYSHPAGQARLVQALLGGVPGLNTLIATDAPKVQSMASRI